MHRVVSDYTPDENISSNIKVFVRARPLEEDGIVSDFIIKDPDNDRKVIIRDPDPNNRKYGEIGFQFDRIYWTDVKQDEIFNDVCRPQVDQILNGYNCCCFAYGQTGSGKFLDGLDWLDNANVWID